MSVRRQWYACAVCPQVHAREQYIASEQPSEGAYTSAKVGLGTLGHFS